MTTNADLCQQHGIAVYQVGEVYGNAPPDTLRKFFVSVVSGDFPDNDITAIPLADTREEAHAYAVKYLELTNPK